MTPERWQAVETVFNAALARDPEARTTFLDEACGQDRELRREVESLLRKDEEVGSFLESSETAQTATTLVGRQFGSYQVLSLIGAGGMGEVYRAHDRKLGRDVALKILPFAFVRDPQLLDRFRREARTLASLNHPNIITVYDTGSEDGIHYIAMEYVPGRALNQLIGRSGLRISEALRYARQMADALAAAHAAGILHRDLKPANVMIHEAGLVKMLDFGLAQALLKQTRDDGETQTLATKAGIIVGTIAYMSPEQAEGKKLDFRSDIFSFGAVLYEMLTGTRPFTGNSQAATLASILQDEPQTPSALREDLPPEIEKLILRCLRKDPARRAQTMADLRVALEDLEEESKTPRTATASARRKAFPWLAAVALLGLLFAAAVGAYWLMWARTRLPDLPSWRLRPLTAYAGNEEMPAISPDGNQVAFAWNGERQDNLHIYVKQIGDDAAPLRISRDEAAEIAPCWSPDGKRLAFLRQRLNGSELVVSSALGGGERILANLSYSPSLSIYSSISWSPDGRFIAAIDGSAIVRTDVETREVRRLTEQLPPGISDLMPSYAPDGTALAFTRGLDLATRQIWVQGLDRRGDPKGKPTRLTEESDSFLGITWMPERRSLLTSKGFPGSFQQMVRVTLDGGMLQEVPVDTLAVWYPSYNAIRHRLVYERRWMDLDILRFSLDKPNEAPTPVIASTHLDFALDVSPDGKRIVFESTRDGRQGIWRAERDGTNQIRLATQAFGSPRWSPDGKWVVFDGKHQGQSNIYVVSADGGVPRQFSGTASKDIRPSVSPDGKWVYFNSPVSGQQEIWRTPWAGGTPSQVTHGGGGNAIPSPDGKWVYYSRSRAVWRVPPDRGRETRILDDIPAGYWTLAGDLVYYLHRNGERSSVVELEPSSGRSRVVYRFPFTLEPAYPVSAIGISLATREVFVVHRVRFESDLVLVENFQ